MLILAQQSGCCVLYVYYCRIRPTGTLQWYCNGFGQTGKFCVTGVQCVS